MRRSGALVRDHLSFVLLDPEADNFTFEITNTPELAHWAAAVAGCSRDDAAAYVAEPSSDGVLRASLGRATAGHWMWSKRLPPFGKRLGWYAIARALRPRLVVEVGAHDGLGSLLLLRALERNQETGHEGRLVSFDINPTAGWLVGSHPLWQFRHESSTDGLPRVLARESPVGLFIYDGWHTHDAERADLLTALAHLAPNGVLVSDDAQVTHALAEVASEHGLVYREFHEMPARHFDPGAVLGASTRPTEASA